MARSPSPLDVQFLISKQLNVLHLNEIVEGGESLHRAPATQHHNDGKEAPNLKVEQIDEDVIIKEEDISEDEAQVPSDSENDEMPRNRLSKSPETKLDGKARFRAQLEKDDFMVVDEVNLEENREKLEQDMEAERKRFTGANHWAPVENRLFELLYMREQLPMMPRHWEYDFQGVPFQDHVFSTSEENPPAIHAHSRKTEFQATRGMMKLIDLSAKVRTLLQTGAATKAPKLIERTLNGFLSWAAADGDYQRLEIIPNMIVEVVDAKGNHGAVIKERMEALARLQRDFLRVDRDDHGWQGIKEEVLDQGFLMAGSPPQSARSRAKPYVHTTHPPTTKFEDADYVSRRTAITDASPLRRSVHFADSPSNGTREPVSEKRKRSPKDTTASPRNLKKPRRESKTPTKVTNGRTLALRTPPSSMQQDGFSRRPPVVWGLFIINTSVFLCTLDSAKEGKDAYVSWHAEIAFSQTRQCVWHALTVGLVVCLARDELMTRLEDFEHLTKEKEEADPDR